MSTKAARGAWTAIGTVGAALLAHVPCCLPPLLMAFGGASAGFASALAPYRPWLLAFAAVQLGIGFYLAYRPERCGVAGCGCDHSHGSHRKLQRTLMWGALGVFAWASFAPVHHHEAQVAQIQSTAPNQIVVALEGLHCDSHAKEIEGALAELPGVEGVRIEGETAIVTVAAAGPSQADLREAVLHASHAH